MEKNETTDNTQKSKITEAQKRAVKKYYEKNKEICQARNTIYVNNKYNNDEVYREKKRKLSLERYYKKKSENSKSSDPQNPKSSDPQNSEN